MQLPTVLDLQGQQRDREWLAASFGPVCVERAEAAGDVKQAYRLVELREATGPAALLVNVVDGQGQPLSGVQVVRSWPNAPQLPAWPAPASRWQERGVSGPTDANGNIGFGLGAGDSYALPAAGPAAVWVAGPAGPSDLVSGLGMLDTAHHRHLDLRFQQQSLAELAAESARPVVAASASAAVLEGPAAPPSPPAALPALTDDQCKLLIDRLDLIIQALEERLKQ